MVTVAATVLPFHLGDAGNAETAARVADTANGRLVMQDRTPLVFACSGCSFAGQLADSVARELDRQQFAEMSCLAGVGAKHPTFLRKLPGRRVWIVDGCTIECARGVFEQAAQAKFVTTHIRLHDWGFKKNQPPADGVDVPALAHRIARAFA